MEMFGETVTQDDFNSDIINIDVFGVNIDCNIECSWNFGRDAWGDTIIEISDCNLTVGNNYAVLPDESWHRAIINELEELVQGTILTWANKQEEDY